MPYFVHTVGLDVALLVEVETPEWPDPCQCCTDCRLKSANTVHAYALAMQAMQTPPYLAVFPTAAEAYQAKKALHSAEPLMVTFRPSEAELSNWRYWESRRFGQYGATPNSQAAPWMTADWYQPLAALHYCYLSVEKPGLVAYTPSEEWGCTDRQLRVRPGRYLEQFAPHLTQVERDEYCAKVKAFDDRNVVLFATTANDIERVYRKGPSSCMSHGRDHFASSMHPVRVYGGSDLSVAYLANEDGAVRARAIVWQEKKQFGRVYGDATLQMLLAAHGWTYTDLMEDARIPATLDDHHDCYIMPYLDVATSVELDGKQFILSTAVIDHERVFDARTVNGLTDGTIEHNSNDDEDDQPETYYCRNSDACDNEVEDYDTLCSRCERLRFDCAECDEECFDTIRYRVEDVGRVCESCYDDDKQRCESCDTVFHERSYPDDVQANRSTAGLTAYCYTCSERRTSHEETEPFLPEIATS